MTDDAANQDDLRLSLHLDGRLALEEAQRLDARLAAEPELKARWDALRRLHELSQKLDPVRGSFTPADVRARSLRTVPTGQKMQGGAGAAHGRWRPWAAAAAAVFLLALTHAGAYRLGARDQTAIEQATTPIEDTEEVLRRLAAVDPATPPGRLDTTLAGLREDLRPLPGRLTEFVRDEPGPGERTRAAHLADAIVQIELAFEGMRDVGFQAMTVRTLASGSLKGTLPLRFLPASAQRWARVDPVDKNRFRVVIVRRVDGLPRLATDVGTLAELRVRHEDIQFVTGK